MHHITAVLSVAYLLPFVGVEGVSSSSSFFSSSSSSSSSSRTADATAHLGSNHNPRFQRNPATNCMNNDIVVREDMDELPCIYLQDWATGVADDELATQGLSWDINVLSDNGNFNGIWDTTPCIDLNLGTPTSTACCPDMVGCANPSMGGCNTGNLYGKVREHRFGHSTVEVTLQDTGPCVGTTVCTPLMCCRSHTLEFHLTVVAVNDCPEFQFTPVDIDENGAVITQYPAVAAGVGGTINTFEDVYVCMALLVGVGYGGWNEGPAALAPAGQPWHDQVLVWTVNILDDSSMFKTAPHVRYVEGEATAQLCFLPALDRSGRVRISIHLEDTGGSIADTTGTAPVPACFTSMGAVGCYIRALDEEIEIIIAEVNDPPIFNRGPAQVIVLEDSGSYDRIWASDIRPGPPDEVANRQKLSHFEVTLLVADHIALFLEPPKIDLAGRLTFKARKNINTYGQEVLVSVRLWDYPQTPLVSISSVAPDPTFRIIIEPVNDPPFFEAIQPRDIEVFEDQQNIVIPWANQNTLCPGWDPDELRCIPNEGPTYELNGMQYPGEDQTVAFIVIPQDASLFNGLPYVNANGEILFELAKDANGATNVTILAKDDGGVSPGEDTGPVTKFTITVVPVNDPPTFQIVSQSVTVKEDSGPYSKLRFLYEISPGPSDEIHQELNIQVRATNPELFAASPTLTLDGQGTSAELTFEPLPDAFGMASVFFYLQDSGGTLANGDDRSDGHEIHIYIEGTNDSPIILLGAHPIVLEDVYSSKNSTTGGQDYRYKDKGWMRIVSPGGKEEKIQYVECDVSCDPSSIFKDQPTISPTGDLSFSTMPDAFGNALCSVKAWDVQYGVNNTNLRLSTIDTLRFNVGVQRVNDAPDFLPGLPIVEYECGVSNIQNCSKRFPQWATSISAGPLEGYQQYTFSVSTAGLADNIFSKIPEISGDGTLSFTLLPEGFIEPAATLSVTMTDDGGSVYGGVNSITKSLSLEVKPSDVVRVVAGGPVRLSLRQQPKVNGGSSTPAMFELLDSKSLAVAAEGVWSFKLIDTTDGVKHTEIRTLQTASASFEGLTVAGPGTYTVAANVTVGVLTLSATSQPFIVQADQGALSATLMRQEDVIGGDTLSERDLESGAAYVEVTIGAGEGVWDAEKLAGLALTVSGVASVPAYTILGKTLRVQLPAANLLRSGVITVSVPAGATGTDSAAQLFTYGVQKTPLVRAYVTSTASSTDRLGTTLQSNTTTTIQEKDLQAGVEVFVEVDHDEWVSTKAAAAVQNSVTPMSGEGTLGAGWYTMVSATYDSAARVTLAIKTTEALATTDGFSLSLDKLQAGLSSQIRPEWESDAFTFNVIPTEVEESSVDGVWKAFAIIAALLAWVLTVVGVIGALVGGALNPAAQMAYITLVVIPVGPQPQLEIRHVLQWLWKPFRMELGGNESFGAVVILIIVVVVCVALHALSALLASRRNNKDHSKTDSRALVQFPSLSIALTALALPMLTYNVTSVTAWSGESNEYGDTTPTAVTTAGRVVSPLLLLAVMVVHMIVLFRSLQKGVRSSWCNPPGKGASFNPSGEWVSTPEVRAVERYGSVFMWYSLGTEVVMGCTDTGCAFLFALFAGIADPRGVGVNGDAGRAAVFLCAAVAGGRAAVLLSYSPHLYWVAGYADVAASCLVACGAGFLMAYLSLSDNASDDVALRRTTSHWSAVVSAILLLLAMLASIIVVSIFAFYGFRKQIARYKSFKRGKDGPQHLEAETEEMGVKGKDVKTNPISNVFPGRDVESADSGSSPSLQTNNSQGERGLRA